VVAVPLKGVACAFHARAPPNVNAAVDIIAINNLRMLASLLSPIGSAIAETKQKHGCQVLCSDRGRGTPKFNSFVERVGTDYAAGWLFGDGWHADSRRP
jgi:hypothetical protein